MRCDEFSSKTDDYIDCLLSEEAQLEMRTHAEKCPKCQALLREVEKLHAYLGTLDTNICVPLEARAAWRTAIRREDKRKRTRPFLRIASGIAAAFVLMVGMTFGFRASGMLDMRQTEDISEDIPQRMVADAVAEDGFFAKSSMLVLESDGISSEDAAPTQNADGVIAIADTTPLPESHIFVKSASREMQSDAFDKDYALICDLIEEYDGYLQSDMTEKDAFGRIATLTAQIPIEDAAAFLSAIDHTAEVVRREDNAEDISDLYFDAQSRLDTLQAEKERLLALVEDAADADAIDELQRSLQDVYASIDAVYSKIAGYRGQLENMEVKITLYEGSVRTLSQTVDTADSSLGSRMAKAFHASSAFLEDMLVSAAIIAPFVLILIGIFLVVGIVLICVKRTKHNK